MQILLETTKWKYPAHTYVLNKGGKLVGYYSDQHGWQVFKKPMSFYKKHRTFTSVKVQLPVEFKKFK